MIIRVVKMTFLPGEAGNFRKLFAEYGERIRSAQGCTHLELWNDVDHPGIFFTYSHWLSAEDLARYRDSDLFREVWTKTKKMFETPAEAWSVVKSFPIA
jgi:quinol monooxygenase YgiN